ncbi:TadE/TadG family type IV pilus assembly protein [Sinomonas atrocyanea]|uniref:TadE/TadG family type IV pilus assembly protein n=1 Tax=Sinomonas atrocyanea TaxID=37927 RepID=UPI00286087A8|nr:TadE/TadG family type IV pilus assembly protein [Sinomonas atrocyanea]MDR6620908.1 Flp pilus assembly protein TadG [Sinomonas atrocyanea]
MRARRHRAEGTREKGAAAVEFALIVPILLALVLGIVEFGHIYNAQLVITNAAREAARTMAVTGDPGTALTAAQSVAPGFALTVSPQPLACVTDPTNAKLKQVTATVTSNVPLIAGTWLNPAGTISISGVGVMRCEG